jgi:hypothetical protein
MLNLQHQHNTITTTPHMRVDPSVSGAHPHVRGCCDGVVYESNPISVHIRMAKIKYLHL